MAISHAQVRNVRSAINTSAFLKDVARARKGLFPTRTLRRLSTAEIQQLEKQGNTSQSKTWDNIRVGPGFTAENIRNTAFLGKAVLGAFRETVIIDGICCQSGIYNATLGNVQVGNGALVHEVGLLSSVALFEKSVCMHCGTIAHQGESSFGNGQRVNITIETGGRAIPVHADMSLQNAIHIATHRSDAPLQAAYQSAVKAYAVAASSRWTIIGPGARISNSACVKNTFLGEAGLIDNALLVEESTILSSVNEPSTINHGALVRASLVQWGSLVTTMGMVTESVLIEHASVERHGKVSASVIGPNTAIGSGEVISCLLGPFIGFHHQALLIASFWPMGKGNVSYGANIGSNHTSRAPDQENWIGEGFFFGLGTNIKFPADFTRAPFSLLAANCQTLPQRIFFPFSLISPPAEIFPGISPAINEISPGWVLSDNIFAIRRNEAKYRARNRAQRTPIEFETFRPAIIDLMVEARALLDIPNIKDLYTDRDIPGIGKNFMKEAGRIKGRDAYTFYIRHYCLLGLLRKVDFLLKSGKRVPASLVEIHDRDDARWEHERLLLQREFPGETMAHCLSLLKEMQRKIALLVQASKEKDDARGRQIIPDYADAHTSADKDLFVKETWAETRALCAAADRASARL